ncbi:MAG: aminotransferase class I/II-fold pyridoxal phosphate-dependent enzyme [Ruminococcaceae bacterium]|nr:aminotransferase class I/II-fold pyridoxal phosphate-dependent enzyme [Oscillospiraceae bacterium]
MFDYSKVLSSTVSEMKPSGIRKFFDMLQEMKDVVGLTVGQPDFVTPWHIREAGIDSLKDGKTYYTSNAGLLELRCEIAKYLDRRFSLKYDGEKEVVVTVGGSEAIDIAIRACVENGDEVIVPTPCFVCYEPCVRLAGGVPVILETKPENKFKVDPEELKSLITPRTKMLILAYPNNPTGAIMTEDELKAIAEVIKDTNIVVLSDEIYSELTYGRRHTSFANLEGMHERTIIVSGFSKSYAMTGWRMGYIAAPQPLASQMLKLHQYVIMCAPTTSQFAALEAVMNGDDDIEMMKEEYDRRRKYLVKRFAKMGVECFEPEGAFYAFPNIGQFGLSSEEFCEKLLYEHKCAIIPGTAFGRNGEGFARISYAYSIKHIDQALDRIEEFVKTF